MTEAADSRRPVWVDAIILAVSAVAFVSMVLLGNWQMDRLAWKLDLIERVEARAFAEPVEAPLGVEAPEYLRVTVTGTFAHDQAVRVKAVTDLGPGHWIVTPLAVDAGVIWINRGFVTSRNLILSEPEGLIAIEGLVRVSKPDGTLLEANDPTLGRWFSIDVPALSGAAGLGAAAPYYIAADHIGAPEAWPRGGLTKLEFRNTHLSYALTWYAMALLFFAAMCFVIWDRRNRRAAD